MSDLVEHALREAFTERAELITPEASARLRAVDYRPRLRRFPSRPALGAMGLSAAAAAGGAAVLLASSAAPAFAGWTARPTAPHPGQLAFAAQRCEASAGAPVLSDTRGPYTATIYADGTTCLQGNGITINSSRIGGDQANPPAGAVELRGVGEADSNGDALTMVDGRIGAGVTGVTIARSDGSSVQATVKNGWYLAWWPGTERAATAQVVSANGTSTQPFPTTTNTPPPCPANAQCSSSYGFDSTGAHGGAQTSISGSSSSSR
jgi:hypothetical protein